MGKMYVAFDTETTGVQPGSRVVEIAAVGFDETGSVLDVFEVIIDPGMAVPPDAAAVHGLGTEQVQGRPSTRLALERFAAWLPEEAVLLAHNAPFDMGVLHWEFERVGLTMPAMPVVDTLPMSRRAAPGGRHDLTSMVERFGLSMEGDAHRALPDADAVRQLFLVMSGEAPEDPVMWEPCYRYTSELPEVLVSLPVQVEQAAPLSFVYTEKRGQTFRKTITPYGWALGRESLQFHGLCHYAGERRMFVAERIKGGA